MPSSISDLSCHCPAAPALLVQVFEHQNGVAHLLVLALFLFGEAFDETGAGIEAQYGRLVDGIHRQQANGKRRCGNDATDQRNECITNVAALQARRYSQLGDFGCRVISDRYIKGQAQVRALAAAEVYGIGGQTEITHGCVIAWSKHHDSAGQAGVS